MYAIRSYYVRAGAGLRAPLHADQGVEPFLGHDAPGAPGGPDMSDHWDDLAPRERGRNNFV